MRILQKKKNMSCDEQVDRPVDGPKIIGVLVSIMDLRVLYKKWNLDRKNTKSKSGSS